MAQLHDLSAVELAAAVRGGEVSPTDLVEHYLARIERLDGELGAFITVTAEAAREQAAEASRAVASGEPLPPLHGVPIGIKDLNFTAGVRTTMGSAVFADFVPPVDDFVVARLRAAGTISLGKTNTPELGLPCYTEPAIAGAARCPWDTTRYAGGSSGGAAAAVAGGLLPFAQGSDGGGSIRIPASINGLFGIKPSRGLISPGPLRADVSGLSTDGPLARTVRDAAALLDAMAGPMPGDMFAAPQLPHGERYLDHVGRDPGRLRIGRYLTPIIADAPVHPEVRAAWEDASRLLAELGHDVVDAQPPFGPEQVPAFEVIWAVAACGVPIDAGDESRLLPLTRYLRHRGEAISAPEYFRARGQLQMAAWAGLAATAEYDVLLSPTLSMPPRPLGWFGEDGAGAGDFERQKRYAPYTAMFNITGQPAVSVPLYRTAGAEPGLPIGSMLVGRHGSEPMLIALASQLEAARPWAVDHPPLW